MSASDVPTDSVTPAALGPYILAASHIHGPAPGGNVQTHVNKVVQTGVSLLIAAQGAARDALREMPIRSFDVTGVLSIENTRNANRTQIGIDTGQSHYGADKMWTEYEDEPQAARTRAVLQSLVGQTVIGTKQTFHEYDHNGDHVLTDKNEKQTRTRLAPGSLVLVSADGSKTPVDLTAAARDAADKSPFVDAAATYQWLVEQHGENRAAAAWGELPRSGQVARDLASGAHRNCASVPVAAAA